MKGKPAFPESARVFVKKVMNNLIADVGSNNLPWFLVENYKNIGDRGSVPTLNHLKKTK